MLSLSQCPSVKRAARRSATQCAARRRRGEVEASWALFALVLMTARLQSDVNVEEDMELRRLLSDGHAAPNAQLGDSIPVVLLEPVTSEASRSLPVRPR